MTKKHDLLKEVLADVDDIKKLALANAKKTLSETFEPVLKSLINDKMNEADDEEDDTEEIDETTDETVDVDEAKKKKAEDDTEEEAPAEEDDDMDETIDIDAILAEVGDDEDKDDEDEVDEAKKKQKDDSCDDDMPDEDAEEDLDEEIDLNQLLGELSETKDDPEAEDEKDEDQEDVDEATEADKLKDPKILQKLKAVAGDKFAAIVKFFQDEISPSSVKAGGKYDAAQGKASTLPSNVASENKELKHELAEMKKSYISTAKKVNETNLINAKLILLTKFLNEVELKADQKVKVIKAFDKAKTAKDAKLVYQTLSESFKKTKTTKKPLKEAKSIASKISGGSTKKEIINENATYNRWQQLAGLSD